MAAKTAWLSIFCMKRMLKKRTAFDQLKNNSMQFILLFCLRDDDEIGINKEKLDPESILSEEKKREEIMEIRLKAWPWVSLKVSNKTNISMIKPETRKFEALTVKKLKLKPPKESSFASGVPIFAFCFI